MASFFMLAAASAAASEREAPRITSIEPPLEILFIGNSFTYYNNGLQNHVGRLTRSLGREAGRYRIQTLSGGYFREHVGSISSIANSRDWDVIVLQGHSTEAMQDAKLDSFRASARELDAIVRDSGAETVLFMTWAYEGSPEQTDIIANNYTLAGNELGALVVPVGDAFALAAEIMPDVELRIADGRHPSLAGTYLAACTFFAAFHHASPVGAEYTAGLPADIAAGLQAAAWEAVSSYFDR